MYPDSPRGFLGITICWHQSSVVLIVDLPPFYFLSVYLFTVGAFRSDQAQPDLTA